MYTLFARDTFGFVWQKIAVLHEVLQMMMIMCVCTFPKLGKGHFKV
jgi:hypothetical protein